MGRHDWQRDKWYHNEIVLIVHSHTVVLEMFLRKLHLPALSNHRCYLPVTYFWLTPIRYTCHWNAVVTCYRFPPSFTPSHNYHRRPVHSTQPMSPKAPHTCHHLSHLFFLSISRFAYPVLMTLVLLTIQYPGLLGQFIASHLSTHHQVGNDPLRSFDFGLWIFLIHSTSPSSIPLFLRFRRHFVLHPPFCVFQSLSKILLAIRCQISDDFFSSVSNFPLQFSPKLVSPLAVISPPAGCCTLCC